MVERLSLMLGMQQDLQLTIPPKGVDPAAHEGDKMASHVRDMVIALEDELHEAMNETGWKPWATSRHFNAEPFTKELVDAWHFFMNLMLVGAHQLGMSAEEYADYFTRQYITKNVINRERHEKGEYDGLNKCPKCKRDLNEVEPDHLETCNA